MKTAILFTAFLISRSATLLPQSATPNKTPPAAPAYPSPPKDVKPPVPPKDGAAPNAELEKLKAEREAIEKAKELVREWVKRWNALDGTEESVNKLVELYRPDALHLTGPQDDLIGTAYYQGHEMIRKLAEHAGKTYCRQAFYIKNRTSLNQVGEGGGSKTSELITAAASPLGGISAVVEIGASYDYRETKKRFMAPAAAFFDIQDGKITRLRMYFSKGEHFEVTNQAGCTN